MNLIGSSHTALGASLDKDLSHAFQELIKGKQFKRTWHFWDGKGSLISINWSCQALPLS